MRRTWLSSITSITYEKNERNNNQLLKEKNEITYNVDEVVAAGSDDGEGEEELSVKVNDDDDDWPSAKRPRTGSRPGEAIVTLIFYCRSRHCHHTIMVKRRR